MFIVAVFVIAPEWEHPKCGSIEDWIDKLCCIHTGNEPVIHLTTWDRSQIYAEQKPDTRGHSV